MVTSYAARIQFGGALSEQALADLIEAALDDGVGDDWTEPMRSPELVMDCLRACAKASECVNWFDNEAMSGRMFEVEAALRKHAIAYALDMDGEGNEGPCRLKWTPVPDAQTSLEGSEEWISTDGGGEPVMSLTLLKSFRENGEGLAGAIAYLERFAAEPPALVLAGGLDLAQGRL
jgi:hypothetical protein